MKRFIAVLSFFVVLAIPVVASANPDPIKFTDVPPGSSHYNGVSWAVEQGIQGYGDGTYGPNNPLSRQHAAIFFTRVLDLPILDKSEVTNYFEDVSPDHTYAGFIATVGWAEIFSGYKGNFNPEQILTREQMATILVAAYQLESVGADVPIHLDNVSKSHKDNVQTIANLGITGEIEDFRPREPITRGQFATFLHNTNMHIQNESEIEDVLPEPEPEPEPKPEAPPTPEQEYIIETTHYAKDFSEVVQQQMTVSPQTDSRGTWYDAGPELTAYYLNPNNFEANDPGFYQFLKLTKPAGLDAAEVNEHILSGKGILEGTGAYFIEASERYGLNELYLIVHALLETGNGTSTLANGIEVDGKTVYNMFGIGAVDSCPDRCGSERASEEGWFSPKEAILGGAAFVSGDYLGVGQDTLYKMRWNPDGLLLVGNPTHQYATDVGWAVKQAAAMHAWYQQFDSYRLTFEFPAYRNQPAKTTRPYGEAEFKIDPSNSGEFYVTTADLNMRSAPSTEYSILATLPLGTKVETIGNNSGWYKVKVNGLEGWVSTDYLEEYK